MQKNIFKCLLLLFLVVGFAANSMAGPPGDFNRPTKEQKERVRKRIETLRIWKLTEALDLDEKTAAQIFPILHKYDKKRGEIERDIRENMFDLRETLKNKQEDRLRNLLEQLEKKHKALQRLNDEERRDLRNILTIEQQAKFIIFKRDFDREIRKIIAEARERRHQRSGKGMLEKPFSERPFIP